MRIKIPKEGYQELTVAKARLIGHFIGDGAVYRHKHDYIMKYEVKDRESLFQVYQDLMTVYGLPLTTGWHRSGKTGLLLPLVRLRSKLVYEDLLRYVESYYSKEWKLRNILIHVPDDILTAFLQALYDDEGSVTQKQIRLYSINKPGLEQVKLLMERLGFRDLFFRSGYGEARNVYGLITKDFYLFSEVIGFSLERKQHKVQEYLPLA